MFGRHWIRYVVIHSNEKVCDIDFVFALICFTPAGRSFHAWDFQLEVGEEPSNKSAMGDTTNMFVPLGFRLVCVNLYTFPHLHSSPTSPNLLLPPSRSRLLAWYDWFLIRETLGQALNAQDVHYLRAFVISFSVQFAYIIMKCDP